MVEDAHAAVPVDLVALEREVHFFDAVVLGTGAEGGFGARRAAAEQDAVGCVHGSDDMPSPTMSGMAASETIEAEGHLIDSGLLSGIFDKIIEVQGVLRDPATSTSGAPTTTRRASRCASRRPTRAALADLLQQLTTFGCHAVKREGRGA